MDNINTQTPEPQENNKKLIIIASVAIAILVAGFVILGMSLGWFDGKSSNDKATSATVPTISVVETKGSESKTVKAKINVRDVKFKDSVKKVKKFEKAQKDTQDNPSEATSKDGYTYVTYMFSPKAKYFGVSPANSQSGALLQYVFKDKKLFDIRIQFGALDKKARAKVKKNIMKKYGKPTYSIKYSNGSTKDTWKTASKDLSKQTLLSLNYSANSGTILDFESFSR